MSPRILFRIVAITEAVTWTMLITGLILKYGVEADFGQTAVSIAGFAHGLVFLAYGLTVLLVGINQRWRLPLILVAVVTAGIPYAAIIFDVWADKSGRLNGPWLRTAADPADRRDHTWYARTVRWGLNHPVPLAIGMVALLAVMMTTLLVNGPPVSIS